MAKPLSAYEFCAAEQISPESWRRLSRRQLMPRTLVSGGRWRKIAPAELAAWRAQRETDRVRLRRPWLRYPERPLSWVSD